MVPDKLITSVYKTNIAVKDLVSLKLILDNYNKISKWNIDLEDWERILRIESQYAIEKEIISMLNTLNISCIELH
jgi:hypothetical protein